MEVEVAELQSLRQEITTRIGLMNAIVALELAAVGTGLTVLHESTHVLAGLAAISSFLWLLWMDQCLSSYKIAAYLSVELAPRLRALTGHRVLGWENFLRRVEAGRATSARTLFGPSAPRARGLIRTIRSDWYVPLLFGAAPPGLLLLYAMTAHDHRLGVAPTAVGCVLAGGMWAIAFVRFWIFIRSTKILDRAILADSGSR
ncbi:MULTISPECIES: hypothetical protein [Actinomadura]|uniref:Uncharacterized protein n=1 Tax=Actinomadura yumaensis TaxID=111807 RepID=A0ABW2CI19_9ACTN|nr:hypothetical protein [Actinomadura sp. J1-007]MWK37045.1 hypothetical protein [Actinomadura sp. J1-007]